MQTVTTIGLDIAKSVFQVHGVDAHGNVVVRRQLKRRHVLAFFEKLPPCLVGLEACASSHAEFIRAVDLGVLRQCVWPRQQSPPCYFFQDWPDYLATERSNLAKR
jgi:hypothetical protein